VSTAEEGLRVQRLSFRGYVVKWDDGFQVCCGKPHCAAVLRSEFVNALVREMDACGWGCDATLANVCQEHTKKDAEA